MLFISIFYFLNNIKQGYSYTGYQVGEREMFYCTDNDYMIIQEIVFFLTAKDA